MRKEIYYFVPTKDKVTGKLFEIKTFTNMEDANKESMINIEENIGKNKFIERPVVGAFGYDVQDALRVAKMSFPEHMIDSQETLANFKEAIKLDNENKL